MHTIDTEADTFVDDVDFFNVDRQGSAYERYKRRILREAEGLESESDSDEEFYEGEDDSPGFESANESGHRSDWVKQFQIILFMWSKLKRFNLYLYYSNLFKLYSEIIYI